MAMRELVPPDAREEYAGTWAERDKGELERRFVRADGSIGWGLWQRTTISDGHFLAPVRRHLRAQARRGAARAPGRATTR